MVWALYMKFLPATISFLAKKSLLHVFGKRTHCLEFYFQFAMDVTLWWKLHHKDWFSKNTIAVSKGNTVFKLDYTVGCSKSQLFKMKLIHFSLQYVKALFNMTITNYDLLHHHCWSLTMAQAVSHTNYN